MNKDINIKIMLVLTSNHLAKQLEEIQSDFEDCLSERGLDLGDASYFEAINLMSEFVPTVDWSFNAPTAAVKRKSGYSAMQETLSTVRRYVQWMADHMLDDNVSGNQYQRMYESIDNLSLEIEDDFKEAKKEYEGFLKKLVKLDKDKKAIPRKLRQEEEDFEYLGDDEYLEDLISCASKAIPRMIEASAAAEAMAKKDLRLLGAAMDYCEFRGRTRRRESRELFQKMYESM